jgi:hypothetical protein
MKNLEPARACSPLTGQIIVRRREFHAFDKVLQPFAHCQLRSRLAL